MEIKKFDEIDDAAEYLEEISSYEGSEYGEVLSMLSMLWTSYRDYIGDDLKNALEKEIMLQVDLIYDNFELVTKEQTFTRTDTSLEWKS